ncbi:MAG: hypothetical protein WC709_11830 [Thermoleophilia bacterium]
MDASRPTLPQRVTAVLGTKQRLVFFAIGLHTLDFIVPVISAWLYRGAPIADVLARARGALADAIAARSPLIAVLFVAYLLTTAWLRAGYIRSLIGRLHLRPLDVRQFLRLLGLELLLELLRLAAVGAVLLAGDDLLVADLAVIGLLLASFAVLYTDYIIVIANEGLGGALLDSVRTVRAAFLPSTVVLIAVTLISQLAGGLLDGDVTGSLAQAAPMLLVRCVLMGAALFVADVVLVIVYLDAVESGRLRAAPR